MKTSIIVNTCALGPRARSVTGSTTPTPHAMRAYALQHFILPSYASWADEVIVAGEWRPGADYLYLHVPSVYFSCVDALAQRQAGAEVATGDLLVFVHDDHFFAPWSINELGCDDADIWVPERWRQEPGGEALLNNGTFDGYIGGHCVVMRDWVAKAAKWSDVAKIHTWDVDFTQRAQAAGARILWNPYGVDVFDVEVAT